MFKRPVLRPGTTYPAPRVRDPRYAYTRQGVRDLNPKIQRPDKPRG